MGAHACFPSTAVLSLNNNSGPTRFRPYSAMESEDTEALKVTGKLKFAERRLSRSNG